MPATPFDKFEAVNKLLDFQLDRDFFITKQDASDQRKPKITIGSEQYTRVELHKKTVPQLKNLCNLGGFEVTGTGKHSTKCLKQDYLQTLDMQFKKLVKKPIDKARAVAKKIEDGPPMFTLYKNQFNGIDNVDQRVGYMKSKIRISLLNYKLRFVLALLQTLFVQSAALANEYFLLKKIRNRFANNKFSTVDRVDYLLSLWKKKAEAETR